MTITVGRRPVVDADEPFLFEVYAGTRADELALVDWDEQQKRDFVEMQFRAQNQDYQRRFPTADHSILLVDDEPVGRVWIGRWTDELRLLDIALHPSRQNEGIGTVVLRELQEEAVAAGKPLRHAVFTGNDDGLRFYGRLGFEVVEEFELYALMEWTGRDDLEVAAPD